MSAAARCDLLRHDQRGATVVEFALVLPVLLLALFGLFDLSYNMYTASMLHGAIQKAARDASIEGAAPTELDARVADAVHAIAPGAQIDFARKSYANFSDVTRPEDFTDTNGDGTCGSGEPFEDVNANGVWDNDRGVTGQGGARDAVLYTVEVNYPRMFPIAGFAGIPDSYTATARTVLRNQPWGLQNIAPPTVRNCA